MLHHKWQTVKHRLHHRLHYELQSVFFLVRKSQVFTHFLVESVVDLLTLSVLMLLGSSSARVVCLKTPFFWIQYFFPLVYNREQRQKEAAKTTIVNSFPKDRDYRREAMQATVASSFPTSKCFASWKMYTFEWLSAVLFSLSHSRALVHKTFCISKLC